MTNRGFWIVAFICIFTAAGVAIGVMTFLDRDRGDPRLDGESLLHGVEAVPPVGGNPVGPSPSPNPTAGPGPTAEPGSTAEPGPVASPEPVATPEPTPAPTSPPAFGTINVPLLEVVDNSYLPWNLILANPFNALPADWSPPLLRTSCGFNFDARAVEALEAFMASSRANGNSPILISAFRNMEHQTRLFNQRIQRFIDEDNMSFDDAKAAARRIVAYPGTSEHNLGLAVDIVCNTYHGLTDRQGTTPNGRWMALNAHYYGFILRYPADKTHITHIIYEPWHFRYVGKDAAYEIFHRGLVLEEFLSELFYYDLVDLDRFR